MARLEPYDELIQRAALHDPIWRIRLLATLRSYCANDEALVAIAVGDESEIVRRAAADYYPRTAAGGTQVQSLKRRTADLCRGGVFTGRSKAVPLFMWTMRKSSSARRTGKRRSASIRKFEASCNPNLTGGDWLELREAILEAKEEERTLLLEDVPTWGRGF